MLSTVDPFLFTLITSPSTVFNTGGLSHILTVCPYTVHPLALRA